MVLSQYGQKVERYKNVNRKKGDAKKGGGWQFLKGKKLIHRKI